MNLDGSSENILKIGCITTVSPSLVEMLSLCFLRAGLSRIRAADNFILGFPQAWLGTAYHNVISAHRRDNDHSENNTPENDWDAEIAKLLERALAHPLDRRFGDTERWPKYYLVRGMALFRRQEYDKTKVWAAQLDKTKKPQQSKIHREKWLTGAGGRIVGRPDYYDSETVADYKTGNIYEAGDDGPIKQSYVQQMQIYAYLINKTHGTWPSRGRVLPMSGAAVEVELLPADCIQAADNAISLLDKYNSIVETAGDGGALASPSPAACRWCPYQIICPAFWHSVDHSWGQELGGPVIEGIITSGARSIYEKSAVSLNIDNINGTEVSPNIELAPLPLTIHPHLSRILKGSMVRITGLIRRSDGSLRPTVRTVLAEAKDLPILMLQPDLDD